MDKTKSLNQKGVTQLITIFIVIATIGSLIYYIKEERKRNLIQNQQISSQNGSGEELINTLNNTTNPELDVIDYISYTPSEECIEDENVKITKSIIDVGVLDLIVPMGLVSKNHVTPVDHLYFYPRGSFIATEKIPTLYNIYAPADGYIVQIEFFTDQKYRDYRIVLEHSCSTYSYFIHIDALSESILPLTKFSTPELNESNDTSGNQYSNTRIPVRAGQLIGYKSASSFDFAFIDTSQVLEGFISPELYEREPWKVHTVDIFDYAVEPIRSQLLRKNIRNAQPYGGKIDYDIENRLIGNWFLEGTNGYAGLNEQEYWKDHLSIVYDHIDPSQIRVSIGDYAGSTAQYGVRDNTPAPEDVSIETGRIEYELVGYDYYSRRSNKVWNRQTFISDLYAKNYDDQVQGVIMLQVLENNKLKVELFPGKNGADVEDFTNKAVIFER